PDPIQAAAVAELAGAHAVSAHLCENRRHIQDRDIYLLKQTVTTRLNLIIAPVSEMVQVALDVIPQIVTLVAEGADERSRDAGLVVRGKEREFAKIVENLREHTVAVSLFIDPAVEQVKSAARTGATHIELNTEVFANATGKAADEELGRLESAAMAAERLGLVVSAGQGLDYHNAPAIADIKHIAELTIGHALTARAALVGLDTAVRDMMAVL
ncbi:MAG: pyridoxine 5'-phosphate synthase, partial [Chitinivibrionales bacterium]|nr:pyridoxine 5'-phosphate synthase [Chitinivibrionales bacterium]MBD3355566.1 pyridoxine 5'-phosphate synthase [Chitinivibrionales bacterium]